MRLIKSGIETQSNRATENIQEFFIQDLLVFNFKISDTKVFVKGTPPPCASLPSVAPLLRVSKWVSA